MSIEFEGGTAVITGSAGGIGLGMARACLSRGMQVVLSDLAEDRLADTVRSLSAEGAQVAALAADVRTPADLDSSTARGIKYNASSARRDFFSTNSALAATTPAT